MAVTPSRVEITEGGSAVLSASVSPEAASDRAVAWSSSDRSVATVDKSGTVHGLKPGTATVTATAEGKSGTCAVTVKAKAVNVTEVTLDKTELTLTEGETGTLTATVKPDNADNRKVTWSSDKTEIATVDGSGRVTAVKAGEAVITVTTEDGGKTATCKVTVKAKAVNVTEVTLDRAELTLTEGETETLTATVRPDNADNRKVTWSSDKTEIATVDGAGKVTAVKPGEAVVTVTTEDGGKTATCKVTVKAKTVNVTEVTLDRTELTLTEGETETLMATVRPDNADNRKVTWISDKTDVATVGGDGRVTAVKAGEAVITVTTEDGGKTATCKVTVKAKAVNVTDVSLDRTELTLTEGETETLTATVKPDNADNRKVTWSSDKTDVATVDGAGRVTAVKAGEATVTVTTEDGGRTATCKVTVKAKTVNVTEVTLDRTELTLTEGETETLMATVRPDNADNRKVTWISDKTDVATVGGDGRVTAVKAGEAVVTVTTEDGGKTATCKVTVKAKAVNVTDVSLDRTELTLTEGETETLTATVKPDNADNRKVTWSSDKTDVATVDGAGRVTAVKAGEAVITVTTEDGGKTATCKVTVKAKTVPVTGVEVNPWAVTLSVRGTSKLSYTIRPADATNQNVKWESESPSVATVDSEGNVQGVAAGTAKICVTTEDGGFKSYCTVTVKKAESKFEVGGLWYEYFGQNKARVIPDPDGSKYGGNISIPGQIEYGGITYSVVHIGSRAFYECADLKSVTLGEGIEYIGTWAFYNCPNLERITFSSTMGSFNTDNPVFERCPKLEIVTTPKTSESQRYYFYTHGGVLYRHCYYSAYTGTFSKETEALSWLPEKTTGAFAIKDGVEVIDEFSLSFTGIDKIIIPESVKYIGPRFFNDSKTPLEIELNWRTKEDIDRISTIESDPSRFFFVRTDRSAVKVTVPKGTKSLYESHWLWSHLGGIEERP